MTDGPTPEQLDILRRYADGETGTRDTIERLGFHDFADLMIAMAQNDLEMPKPRPSPARDAAIALAREMLEPQLRRGR